MFIVKFVALIYASAIHLHLLATCIDLYRNRAQISVQYPFILDAAGQIILYQQAHQSADIVLYKCWICVSALKCNLLHLSSAILPT